MIVLVEGLDRVGKSTVVDFLRSRIKTPNISVRHEGKPPKGVDAFAWSVSHYQYFFDNLYELPEDDVVIYDRSHIGEYCYGNLYRGYNPDFIWGMEADFLAKLNYNQINHDVYLIVLVDSAKNILSRTDGLSIEQDEIEYVRSRDKFVTAFGLSNIDKKLLIDLDTGIGYSKSVSEVLNEVAKFIGNEYV